MRQLEYSQRLLHRARNVIAPQNGSTGRTLFEGALVGGAKALGASAGIMEGNPADFVSLDSSKAPYLDGDDLLDGWVFGALLRPDTVWINGDTVVRDGRHRDREAITRRFHKTMAGLLSA